ncbi:MAG: flagellar basal body P-ring formation chaperone FlgA [Thermodesulfobacteriota bacterium]
MRSVVASHTGGSPRRVPLAAVAALACAAAVLPRASALAASGSIRVQPQASVVGAVVRLEDVALLDGAARELASLEVGDAPAPGARRRLAGHDLLNRLRAAGLDDSITYHIPAAVTVSRASQTLHEAELRPLVVAALEDALPPGDRVDTVELARPVRVALGAYDVVVGEPSARSTGGGQRRVDVTIFQEGRQAASVPARVGIASFGPVVVARQAVARGAVLRGEDVRVEERRLDELPATVVTSVEEAVGKEARVALAAGRPLTLQALATAPLVARGDAVRVLLETGGMRLSASGEALDTGGAGERVRVVNASSRRELVGRVVAHGTVLVAY